MKKVKFGCECGARARCMPEMSSQQGRKPLQAKADRVSHHGIIAFARLHRADKGLVLQMPRTERQPPHASVV